MHLRAPYLGEHNTAVLTGHLGLSAADVQSLMDDGILTAESMPKEAAAE